MALPPSGTIKISELVAEFGGAAPNSMSQYYRGGGRVPNTAGNSNVPTSGQISLSQFYNASAGFSSDMLPGQSGGFPNYIGYVDGGYGSLSPNGLGGGRTLIVWAQSADDGFAELHIDSPSNPGQSFFQYAGVVGGNYLASSDAGYFYAGTTAVWQWDAGIYGFWDFFFGVNTTVELIF